MTEERIAYNIGNIPCVLSHIAHIKEHDIHIFEVSFAIGKDPEFESLNKWIKTYYTNKPEDTRPKACACIILKDDEIIKCIRCPIKI